MSHYGPATAQLLHANADRVIFPAHAVKQAAAQVFPSYVDADVIPQGLLKDGFGRGDRTTARREVRAELRLHDDAKIVLGCGVREPRKGFDLFVQLAARARSQSTLACRLPVLAFHGAGGAAEAIADGCGITVPYLDIDAMGRELRAILARPTDFAAMGDNAERRVRSTYQFAAYARRILDIASSLGSGGNEKELGSTRAVDPGQRERLLPT
jgi:glycosyltransferase involved in cell wall biosynthesis